MKYAMKLVLLFAFLSGFSAAQTPQPSVATLREWTANTISFVQAQVNKNEWIELHVECQATQYLCGGGASYTRPDGTVVAFSLLYRTEDSQRIHHEAYGTLMNFDEQVVINAVPIYKGIPYNWLLVGVK